jgi:hypothetical protein
VVSLVAFATGCGSEDPSVTPRVSRQLLERVAEVRAAVAAGDRDAADRALASLRSLVAASYRRGRITSTKANTVLTAAAVVEHELDTMPTTTTTTTTTTTAPPPVESPSENGSGKGHGKAKGHDDDD